MKYEIHCLEGSSPDGVNFWPTSDYWALMTLEELRDTMVECAPPGFELPLNELKKYIDIGKCNTLIIDHTDPNQSRMHFVPHIEGYDPPVKSNTVH